MMLIFTVFYGIVLVYFNRQRTMSFFLLGGVVGVTMGGLLLLRGSAFGYVCILLGVEYLLLTVYKQRKPKKTHEDGSQ